MRNNIVKNLNLIIDKIGVKKSDNIYLGLDLMKLSLNLGLKNFTNEIISEIILKEFLKKIGKNGSLVIPVFNFDCIKDKYFDRKYSKGQSGALGNFLLKKYYKNRSKHPMYSFLFFGKNKSKYINKDYLHATGEDSNFNIFFKNNYKMVTLGHHYNTSFTMVHFLEKISNVNYRFDKKFYVNYVDANKKKVKKYFYFFARKKNICKYSAITKKCDIVLKKRRLFNFYRYKKLICFNLKLNETCDLILNDLKKRSFQLVKYIGKGNSNSKQVLNQYNTSLLEKSYFKKKNFKSF